jgi:cytidine deaminase
VSPLTDEELLRRADEATERAYAPYSRLGVGAAILARDGALHEGVNVENAAYPLGTCAESGALAAAVAAGCAPGDLEAIAVTAPPCGGCRQRLYEFRLDRVVYRRGDGTVATRTPAELLPDTFAL